MWKSSVRGIILSQIQFSFQAEPDLDLERVSSQVFSMLDNLAWFHRFPVVTIASVTTIFCVIRYRKSLDALSQKKRQQFIDNAGKLPFWGLFHKLISSITLLHYFDNPVISRNLNIASPRP